MLIFIFSLSFTSGYKFSQKTHFSSIFPIKLQPTCPSISYTGVQNTTCFSLSNSVYTLSDCPTSSSCKFSIKYPSNSQCSEHPPKVSFSVPTQAEYLPCNSTTDCVSGLFCASICSSPNSCENLCYERSMYTCSHIDECAYGSICNNSKCITAFTIPENQPADNKLACISGRINNGLCQSPIKSSADSLPKQCETDEDCIANDKKTEGKCICLPEAGKYCELHESDSMKLEFLLASFESRVKDAYLLFLRIYYFPVLDLEFKWPEYLLNAEEFQLYQEAQAALYFFSVWWIFA